MGTHVGPSGVSRRRFVGTGMVVGVALVAGCSGSVPSPGGAGGSGPGDIAVPSGFDETTAPPIPEEGVTVTVYSGSGTSAEALESFEAAAEDAGWEETGQITVLSGQWSGAGFEKDDEVLVIHASESDGEVTVTVVVGPKDMADSDGATAASDETDDTDDTGSEDAPPQSDAEGEDLPDVPRYPGSVRTEYVHVESADEQGTRVEYLAEASVEEVGEYYEGTVPDHGWTIVQKVERGETVGFIASKQESELHIAYEPSDDYDGYTEIEIAVVQA